MFPEVAALTREIRDHRVASGAVTTTVVPDDVDASRVEALRDLRQRRRRELKNRLLELSVKVSSQIDDGSFAFGLRAGAVVRGRQTYKIDVVDPVVYFTSRQIEWNVRRAFRVRPANRNLLVEQIVRTLEDGTPKTIARTDLRQFFESIDHAALLEFLDDSGLLSATTRRLVRQLLLEYSTITGAKRGLPRGLALSATLAEAYLTPLDRDLTKLEGVLLYARYVDDILIVFVDDPFNPGTAARKKALRKSVRSRGLSMNSSKTSYVETVGFTGPSRSFTFLGYRIQTGSGATKVDISTKRAARFRAKLDAAFDSFESQSTDPRALSALHQRVKFLTGNTRLVNNKRQALVGSHFSNPLINQVTPGFARLDKHLRMRINKLSLKPAQYTALTSLTFSDGIERKRFYRFSPRQLQQIVAVWKNA